MQDGTGSYPFRHLNANAKQLPDVKSASAALITQKQLRTSCHIPSEYSKIPADVQGTSQCS